MAAKQVPSSIPSELAVLGVILLDNARFADAAALRSVDFFLPAHQTLWDVIRDLRAKGEPVDFVTLGEELMRRALLDQIGGPAYLSSLTDGQPKLDNIAHYVKRVRDTARKRRVMQEAARVYRNAAGNGTDVAQLERQAETLEAAPPEKPPVPAVAVEKPTPQIPDSAWCTMALRYREAAGPCTEASDNFHFGAFLTIAGGLLGRLVYYRNPMPLYPNFYTALVGRSGRARKGTSIDFAETVARDVNPDLHWIRGVNSAQGFVQRLCECQDRQEEGRRRTVSAVLRFSELRSLIDKASHEGTRDIIPELSNAFDCPPQLERNTVKHSAAKAPVTSILGGAAPRWIENLKIDDLEGGIGNRFWWIIGAPKKRNAFPPAPRFQLVIHDLGEVRRYWLDKVAGKPEEGTEIRMDDSARAIYDAWYKSLDRYYEHDLFQVLADRMEVHCPKVAMLYAALDRRAVIDERDIRAAIAFCEFLIESISAIFSDYGWAEAARQDKEILEYVRRYPLGVAKRRVQMQFSKWGGELFNKRLAWLTGDDGPLLSERRGRATWLFPNPEEE